MDLDGLDKFQTNVVEKHARSCPAGSLKVVKQKKEGWEVDRSYYCGFCKQSYEMSTGPKKDPGVAQNRGRQMRHINKIMTSSIFKSGCVRAQVQEMFEESDVVCPSHTGLGKMMDKINGALYLLFYFYLCKF